MHLTKHVKFSKNVFRCVHLFLARSLSLKMFLVPIGFVPKWSGYAQNIVALWFSYFLQDLDPNHYPHGHLVFNLCYFLKFNVNKDLIALTFDASISKLGMKLWNKFLFPHPLQIISFLSCTCVSMHETTTHKV